MKLAFRLPILLLSIPLLLSTSCSDEAQLAEQCETQSSCETTTETKTNWASAGGIGAGVVVLGALAGGGGGSGGGGSSSSSSTETNDSANNNPGSTTTTPALIGRLLLFSEAPNPVDSPYPSVPRCCVCAGAGDQLRVIYSQLSRDPNR